MRKELKAGGIKVEAKEAVRTSLVSRNRELYDQLCELELVKERQMVQIR